ncbi:OLC1v1015977C1 [Oldenlandia corymbosa var. corymbosa]|uniref:OLC1v1015977C1 n=1 Tax=Oldenlandia corymbosa var. corymbosa TaxID=529605 RepID=A0AAV1E4W9_OLDCO|nr:OLC1v1015977C1 [Oldenlandia corymbosa var. corymbosa]
MAKSITHKNFLLCYFLLMLGLSVPISGTKYTVPWDNLDLNLTLYPVGKKFHVGDILEFKYATFSSAVFVVDLIGFADCDHSKGYIADAALSGDTFVTLNQTGFMYFISFFEQCITGIKLVITVS